MSAKEDWSQHPRRSAHHGTRWISPRRSEIHLYMRHAAVFRSRHSASCPYRRWTRPCTDGRRQRAGQLRTEYLGPKYLPREVRRARTAQGRSTGGSALGGARPTRTNLGQLSCERLRAIDLARHWVLSATSMKPHDSRQLLPGAQRHIELPRRVTVGLLLLGSRSRSEPMRERAPA